MRLALLWTDMLVWLLVVMVGVWGWKLSRLVEVRQKWYAIFHSKIAMASAITLIFYIFFTLLDSVHFKVTKVEQHKGIYTGEIISLLDIAMIHQKSYSERTYSAPFATTEYAKSIIVGKDGVSRQENLPLRYVSMEDPWKKTIPVLEMGVLFSIIVILLHLLWTKEGSLKEHIRVVWQEETVLPWRTGYGIFSLFVIVLTWLYIMSFSYHVLGTDKVGGDVLYASLKSIRTGVLIGILTTLVMLPLAIFLGVSAGYFRGWVDDLIQYLYTTLSSIPGVLLIAAGVLMMQVMMENHTDWFASTVERSDLRLLFLIFILGMTSWTGLCRLLRAETLRISQMDYVTAAKAFGVSRWYIMVRHIVPNLMHIVLISVVLDFSGLVLSEAVLSYVGIGVDPTMYSWGNMINQARLEMAREPMVWWSLFSSFIFMFILVLAANLLSDRVQHVLDPRNRL
ncbi:MAG: ABC transporter permease [Sulfurovum sp.]|nr:ABC transporter permease [Sulfurovum sp.]